MIPTLILFAISLMMFMMSMNLVYRALRDPTTSRVLGRLTEGHPQMADKALGVEWLDRAFLQAGLGRPSERLGLWLLIWAGAVALAALLGGWFFSGVPGRAAGLRKAFCQLALPASRQAHG